MAGPGKYSFVLEIVMATSESSYFMTKVNDVKNYDLLRVSLVMQMTIYLEKLGHPVRMWKSMHH